jgi:hypothetical protein
MRNGKEEKTLKMMEGAVRKAWRALGWFER